MCIRDRWEGVNNSAEGYINSMSITAVPEPSSIALFAVGGLLFGTVLVRRRARLRGV